jgi:hypothetical protein
VAGEVALEAADRFAGGLAFRLATGDVVLGRGVAAGAGDDDAVKGGVDLPVAALVEALSLLPRPDYGAGACVSSSGGFAQSRTTGSPSGLRPFLAARTLS